MGCSSSCRRENLALVDNGPKIFWDAVEAQVIYWVSLCLGMASLVLGWPSTLLNLQVLSDWWRGGRASPWLEEPLLSIVLVEALREDGLLLCSKVSLNLLLKHASYNGISTWHIPLERGWGGYHPLINGIVGPLTLWKIKSQTSKQTMNNYTLSQHHCQASLH